MRFSLAFALALGLVSPLLAQKEYGFDNRKPSGQPYWKAEESLAKMKVPDEFEVKLFASEPQIVNPVAFTIDEKGRVWVVECFEYPKRTPKGKAPRDRIVILEDTDGDGACDKRTVFAEGKDFPVTEERKKAGLGAFDLCTGIEVGHGGVFVGAAPYLWFIENKNDKPGKFEVLLKGFGSQDTHETLNTFQWGPDGWLYGLHGIFTNSAVRGPKDPTPQPPPPKGEGEKDKAPPSLLGKGDGGLGSLDQLDGPESRINGGIWRYHPTQKKFEIFAEGTSNPWGMDWRNTDGQFILACCVIPHLFHIVPGGVYKRQAGASYNPYVYSYINEICDHTFHKESGWAHAGLISLDVPHMPKRFQNSVIFGSIHGTSIKQNILKPNGSTFTASRGDDFLVSGDKNFRPINMKWGPLGDIYLIDWHDQNPCHQTNPDDWDYERGRIFRIQLKGTQPRKAEDLSIRDKAVWMKLAQTGQNPWEFRTALRLLAELKESKAEMLFNGDSDEQVWRSLLVTGSMFRAPELNHSTFKSLIESMFRNAKGSPAAVALAVRAFTTRAELKAEDIDWLRQFAKDPTAEVRREIASACIHLAERHDVTSLLRELMANREDVKDPIIPQLVWIAYEKALSKKDNPGTPAEKELAWLAEQAPGNEFVRDQIVPKVMRRLVATGKPEDLKLCVEFIAKLPDTPSRERALEGLVVALDKQTVDAPEAWSALYLTILKANNPAHVALANKLAVNFRDPKAVERAIGVASNPDSSTAARVEAVRQLGLLKPTDKTKFLLDLVQNDPVSDVRIEAVRALSVFGDQKIPNALLAAWKGLPPSVRAETINTLASRKEWARSLLQSMAEKKVDRAEVTDNTILRIQAFKDRELDGLIEKAWGRTRATPKELNDLIEKTRASLHDGPASFERGRKVFENNCAKCHKFEGKGAEVGPPLEGAGRDIEYILVNVLDPNRVIGAPYFVRTARLLDDTVFQGLLAEEDEKTITLKIENGVLKRIKKEDLNGPIQVSEKSLMPEGLGYNMSAQDFRDLVRYLMAHPFITHATVNGEPLTAGAPGRLLLPDTKGSPAVVEAKVSVSNEVKSRLLVGSSADYEVRLDGKVIGMGKGTGKQLQPDKDGFDITIPAGEHTLAIVVKGGANNLLYARLLDPDRKLRYAEPAEKK